LQGFGLHDGKPALNQTNKHIIIIVSIDVQRDQNNTLVQCPNQSNEDATAAGTAIAGA